MASDEDAYKCFSDLFGPIILDLHPKFDFRYSYKYEDFTLETLEPFLEGMKEEMTKIDAMQVHLRRNFRSMPFTPLMTKEAKLQVERKVVEVLGELYGYYR
jgi:arginine kinase